MTTPPSEPRPHAEAAFTQRFAGHRLRERRRQLNLSRNMVARAADLRPAAVKAMEHNRIRPSDAAFTRLCNALGLTDERGRAELMVPGPPDHRPTEFASEGGSTAPRSPDIRPRRRRLLAIRGRRQGHQ